jgi:hypothetical protein
MHSHEGMPDRSYLVTLMSSDLPDPQVHQVGVDSPCTCDLWEWIMTLPDLPFIPAFMIVQRRELLDHRYHRSSSRLP